MKKVKITPVVIAVIAVIALAVASLAVPVVIPLLAPAPLPRLTITQNGTVKKCAGEVYAGITINANNVVLENCTSQDSNVNNGGIEINGFDNVVRNNTIINACMVGIKISGGRNLAEGNDISGSRQCGGSGPDADGIRIFNDGNIARGNHIHGIVVTSTINPTAHADCIQSWGTLSNTIIENNICEDIPFAGVQTDGGPNDKVNNIIIRGNVFEANRGLNMWGNTLTITNNVFIGWGNTATHVSIRRSDDGSKNSTNVTFTNNVVLNTTSGLLVQPGAVIKGGNNVFYNVAGFTPASPRKDSGYFGGGWSNDKVQTVNPSLDATYHTGNISLCYAGLGCSNVTFTPSVTSTITRTPTFTKTPTVTLTRTSTLSPTNTDVPPVVIDTFTPSLTVTITPSRTLTNTPTRTRTPTPTVTQPPSGDLCVKITNWPNVSVRKGASTGFPPNGSFSWTETVYIEAIEQVGADQWARVNYHQWFAVKIGTRQYAKVVSCQ